MSEPSAVRVLEAQYIKGSNQIMHRVQLWLGPGRDPLIEWMPIEEWRYWVRLPRDKAIRLANLRLAVSQLLGLGGPPCQP